MLSNDVVLPLARAADKLTQVGDDCTFIETGGDILAVTADVGPRPLIRSLAAHRDDWEASGWLAVVATASDVATAGAKPLLLANCTDAPANLGVDVLTQFMRGYFAAMVEFGFRNGGGDIRQGPVLAARVFGAGTLVGARRVGRGGARAGDRLVVIGPPGSFMAHWTKPLCGSCRGERLRLPSAHHEPVVGLARRLFTFPGTLRQHPAAESFST
jgi:thiamine-monophosphate kinase